MTDVRHGCYRVVVLRSLAAIGIIRPRKRKRANSNVLPSNTFDMSNETALPNRTQTGRGHARMGGWT